MWYDSNHWELIICFRLLASIMTPLSVLWFHWSSLYLSAYNSGDKFLFCVEGEVWRSVILTENIVAMNFDIQYFGSDYVQVYGSDVFRSVTWVYRVSLACTSHSIPTWVLMRWDYSVWHSSKSQTGGVVSFIDGQGSLIQECTCLWRSDKS